MRSAHTYFRADIPTDPSLPQACAPGCSPTTKQSGAGGKGGEGKKKKGGGEARKTLGTYNKRRSEGRGAARAAGTPLAASVRGAEGLAPPPARLAPICHAPAALGRPAAAATSAVRGRGLRPLTQKMTLKPKMKYLMQQLTSGPL